MAPSLSQVLVSGGSSSPFGPAQLAAIFAAICATAFSAVKGYKLYRRNRLIPAVMEAAPPLMEDRDDEKLERLSFVADELEREKNKLQAQVKSYSHQIEDLKQSNDFLYKNNLALTKESERLKLKTEELALKASVPLVRVEEKPPVEKPAIAVANKKEEKRKPKRVSRGKK